MATNSELFSIALRNASIGAIGAIGFITQPEVWPAFAAWAEQRTPGDSWDEEDRLDMIRLGDLFIMLAKNLKDDS